MNTKIEFLFSHFTNFQIQDNKNPHLFSYAFFVHGQLLSFEFWKFGHKIDIYTTANNVWIQHVLVNLKKNQRRVHRLSKNVHRLNYVQNIPWPVDLRLLLTCAFYLQNLQNIVKKWAKNLKFICFCYVSTKHLVFSWAAREFLSLKVFPQRRQP